MLWYSWLLSLYTQLSRLVATGLNAPHNSDSAWQKAKLLMSQEENWITETSKNGLLVFCGHDEFVLMQKLAFVLQTMLIELMALEFHSASQQIWANQRSVKCTALVTVCEGTKFIQTCVLNWNEYSLHQSFITWFGGKKFFWRS